MTNRYYNNNIIDKKLMVNYVSIIKYSVSVRFLRDSVMYTLWWKSVSHGNQNIDFSACPQITC